MVITDNLVRIVRRVRHPVATALEELLPSTRSVTTLGQMSPKHEIERVVDIEDPLLRNELITHNYWRISRRFYERMGQANLVWPTFGSWASAQAGVYMRLGTARPVRLMTAGRSTQVTDLLGRGNRLIFGDIAPPFWRFLDFVDAHEEPKLRALAGSSDLIDELADVLVLDPRSLDETPDGELLMLLAFEQYLRAMLEQDPDARAERIFVANACVGLQEQTRVDCMLDALLDVDAVNDSIQHLATPLRPSITASARVASRTWPVVALVLGDEGPALRRRLKKFHRLLTAVLDGRASQVVGTQIFLELQIGSEQIDLSEDLGGEHFARGLETITLDASDFRQTYARVRQWDRTPDSKLGTAALDWSDLSDRMNFIIDLFRGYQSERRLARHPLGEVLN